MYITLGKAIHFYRDDQAQRSSTTKPSWANPAYIQIQQLKLTWAVQSNFNTTWQLEPITISSNLSNQIRRGKRVQQRLNPSVPSWIPSFLMWHKTEVTWQKVGKLQLAVSQSFSNPFGQGQGRHNQAMKDFETTWNQFIIMPKTCTFWFMNQAHEPKWGKLREMWFGRHQRDPSRVPNIGLQDWHLVWDDAICPKELWF